MDSQDDLLLRIAELELEVDRLDALLLIERMFCDDFKHDIEYLTETCVSIEEFDRLQDALTEMQCRADLAEALVAVLEAAVMEEERSE